MPLLDEDLDWEIPKPETLLSAEPIVLGDGDWELVEDDDDDQDKIANFTMELEFDELEELDAPIPPLPPALPPLPASNEPKDDLETWEPVAPPPPPPAALLAVLDEDQAAAAVSILTKKDPPPLGDELESGLLPIPKLKGDD